ncbi:MAG: cyclic nucleotide-binding domain-containing protein [Verrucomicrobiota bacterium]
MDRDFFTFCTSLKPVELRAIGELSRVQHLSEAEVVYSPGAESDALYIINRGVVEVDHSVTKRSQANIYLSRGDIFGDLEALTGQPRSHLVRAREPVSLQAFQSTDFPELVRRVPMFFKYLCERLAFRLLHEHDVALSPSHCLELSGSLSNFDLTTIYQTITHSAQTGELRIMDEHGKMVSAFFFDEGHPRRGKFQHLAGEEAFWQLFLKESLEGSFSFSSGPQLAPNDLIGGELDRHPSEMLINALQHRDEYQAMREQMGENTMLVRRQKLNFAWPASEPSDLEPIAEQIWQIAYSAPTALFSLYEKCPVCELKIYQIVSTLVRSEHFSLVPREDSEIADSMVA